LKQWRVAVRRLAKRAVRQLADALNFFAPLFAWRQKVEKERLKAESIIAARRDPSCLGMTSKRDYNSRQVFNAF
jgi:hypothetical protein